MNSSQPGVAVSVTQPPWILDRTAGERSTLVATFGGWALDGLDVMVYSFVIPTLIAAWHISKGQAGLLGTAALLISAVGGWRREKCFLLTSPLQEPGFVVSLTAKLHN
jgi:MFS family permease